MGEIVSFEPKPRRRRSGERAVDAQNPQAQKPQAQVLPFLGVRYVRGPEAEAALEKAAYDQATERRLTPPIF